MKELVKRRMMMTDCNHITGRAWFLNEEEGQAYIICYVRANGKQPEEDDWLDHFKFCPNCGSLIRENDDG